METCDGFHDSCIVSAQYISGNHVDAKGDMWCFADSDDHILNITFHSQCKPEVKQFEFELCFTGVRRFYLTGFEDNYGSEIMEASIRFFENILPSKYRAPKRVIVWTNNTDFDPNEKDELTEPSCTYVVACKLKWRIVKD